MEAANATEVRVGQEVLVYSVNDRGAGPARGVITRVGRTLVDIEYRGAFKGERESFRLDTRRRNDRYGHAWFLTPEEAALKARATNARVRLKNHGLELRPGWNLPAAVLEELADVVERTKANA